MVHAPPALEAQALAVVRPASNRPRAPEKAGAVLVVMAGPDEDSGALVPMAGPDGDPAAPAVLTVE